MRYYKDGKEVEPKWYQSGIAQVVYGLLIASVVLGLIQIIFDIK